MDFPSPGQDQDARLCFDCRLNFGTRFVEYLSEDTCEGKRYEAPDIDTIVQSSREGCHICTLFLQHVPDAPLWELQEDGHKIYHNWRSLSNATYLSYFFYPPNDNPEADPEWVIHDLVDIQTQPLPSARSTSTLKLKHGTGSGRTFYRIRSWLRDCEGHSVCSEWRSINQVRKALPTRLIDVEDMRLLCEDDLQNRECKYMTLSHCWGRSASFQLRRHNLVQCREYLLWEDLPETFKDAIVATSVLGVRYLWIDALCIIQDSEEDWIHEARLMDQVYANSYLNISVAASEDSHGGIFRLRRAKEVGPVLITTPELHNLGKKVLCYCEDWIEEVDRAPLNSRAWVVQERFLAPRVVHFGPTEVYWECVTCKSMESLPHGLSLPGVQTSGARIKGLDFDLFNALRNRDANEVLYDVWDSLVTTYCDGALTFTSDRPIAIMGLARVFCNYLQLGPSDYCAGVWRPHARLALMWKRDCTFREGDIPWAGDSSACSWSWLYGEGSVTPGRVIHGARFVLPRPVMEVLDMSTVPVDDPFGPIRSGTARVRAPLCKVSFELDSSGANRVNPLRGRHANIDAEYGRLRLGEDTIEHLLSYQISWDRCAHRRSLPIWNRDFYLLLGKVASFEIPHTSPDREVAMEDLKNSQASGEWYEKRRCKETNVILGPTWGVGEFECLVLTPTGNSRGQFTRVGHIHFFDQEQGRYGRTSEARRMVYVSQILNRHFRSHDVEEDRYDDVDQDFMYIVTLV